MQKLHFLAAMAVILGTTACPTVDSLDDLGTSFTTIDTANDEVDTSTDESGSSDSGSTTDATTTTDTTDGGCGGFGCDCVDSSTCDVGLECNDGICGQPMSDTGTDTTTTDTGGLGDCDPGNEYCLGNGCEGSMGASLVIDVDMDMTPDVGFCQFPCMNNDASMCPTLDGAQIQCVEWNAMTMEQACFAICQLANDTCGAGMECLDAGLGMGFGLCVSTIV